MKTTHQIGVSPFPLITNFLTYAIERQIVSEPSGHGLIQSHASYSRASGLFGDKRDADTTASFIRVIFGRKFKDFNPLTIEVKGKKNQYWIEMPRIQKHWRPQHTTAIDLARELADCASLFDEIYNRKQ